MKTVEHIFDEQKGVRLTAYLQDPSREYAGITTRPAVVVLPGGGYSMCSDREADCIALGYLNAGFHAFVLRYTLHQHGAWPAPLNDFDHAMEVIFEHAKDWAVDCDRIAVCGFSAGGHLAASTATMAKHRPAAAILGYPVIRQDITDACAPGMPSPLDHVDAETCPCFIFSARDDECVPIQSTIDFQNALNSYGIQFESHIYSFGNHGFATGKPPVIGQNTAMRASRWMQDSIAWLGELWGVLGANGCGVPLISRMFNHDHRSGKLDLSCTYGYLDSLPEAKAFMDEIRTLLPKCTPDILENLPYRTLREILYSAGFTLGGVHQYNPAFRGLIHPEKES